MRDVIRGDGGVRVSRFSPSQASAIKEILESGDPVRIRALFSFDDEVDDDHVALRFRLFVKFKFSRYLQSSTPSFHHAAILKMIRAYRHGENHAHAAFRGAAKTALMKLFLVFVFLNDLMAQKKYVKVLCRDGSNSKRIVTDLYNMLLECQDEWGNPFFSEKDAKQEESMMRFMTHRRVLVQSGTVGQYQRGHQQDAYRPDFIWFEDIEDSASVGSAVITEGVIARCDEAIQGLAVDGSWYLTCNYISDFGSVDWFFGRPKTKILITPLTPEAWPSRYPLEKIENLKESAKDWHGDYLCDPVRFDLAEFQKSWFRSWDRLPDHLLVVTSVDLAISQKESADECCVMSVGVAPDGKKYILEYSHGHWLPDRQIEEIFRHQRTWGSSRVVVEAIAYQAALIHFVNDHMRKTNQYFRVEAVTKHAGSKESRIRGLIPQYSSGSIYHPPNSHALEGQLLRFPKSSHDDIADALALQLNFWNSPEISSPQKKTLTPARAYEKLTSEFVKSISTHS